MLNENQSIRIQIEDKLNKLNSELLGNNEIVE